MAKPLYATVRVNFSSTKVVTKEELYKEIGWEDLIDKSAWNNTCAVRMSLALVKSGLNIRGNMRVNKGPYKGKSIETNQVRLAKLLKSQIYLGDPDKYSTVAEAEKGIGRRRGIVSFQRMSSYYGGHIDLVCPDMYLALRCASNCYWDATEIWFWELQ
jgi:hypothetical protein